MRSVDFQTVHTQTPAVERSYQTRNAQPEQEQRLATVIQQQTVDQKMQETQATPQTEGAKIQLEKAKERKRGRRKKKKSDTSPEEHEEQQAQGASGRIDILV